LRLFGWGLVNVPPRATPTTPGAAWPEPGTAEGSGRA